MAANLKTLRSNIVKKEVVLLSLIIAIGAGLRLNGLFWDAPYFFNPDEKRLINWGMELNYFDPGISEWGIVPLLLIKLLTEVLGLFYIPPRADIYLLARGLMLLVSCATIFLVYKLAKKGYSQQSALYAATFTAFTVLHIQYAHFYNLDSLFAFSILLALLPLFNIAHNGYLKSYVWAGLTIGLAITIRLNGIFLFTPLFIAHWINIHRSNIDKGLTLENGLWQKKVANFLKPIFSQRLLLALLLTVGIFVLLTPTSVFNPQKYLFYDGLVWVLLQSKGYLKSQYTLQFEGTTPWFYVSNLLFWAAGPLLLLAYSAGLISAVFKWRKPENLIILSFLLIYFWTATGSRVKFVRYVLPTLPLLNIIAADFFVTARRIAEKKQQAVLKWGLIVCLGLTIIGSGFYALAFANIYSQPDIRIIAAQWIQNNIPSGSTIVHENDITYAPPLEFYNQAQSKYNFREINFYDLYQSSSLRQNWSLPAYLDNLEVKISRRGKSEVLAENNLNLLSDEQKQQYFNERIYCADYIILSDRHYSVYNAKRGLFPAEADYYGRLFNGQLGFHPLEKFERRPNLLGWSIDDTQAELTFRIFDHPTIWIFQSQLSPPYLTQHPPQVQTSNNWANVIKLVGYNIDKTTVAPNGAIKLNLYWEALSNLDRDFTIFLQLQNDAHQIVAQNDYQVAGGLLPTSCWQSGRITVDTTILSIPPQTPLGHYQLKLGWYDVATLERLPLIADVSGEQALGLIDIEIQE